VNFPILYQNLTLDIPQNGGMIKTENRRAGCSGIKAYSPGAAPAGGTPSSMIENMFV
jgi:hypothetical protein